MPVSPTPGQSWEVERQTSSFQVAPGVGHLPTPASYKTAKIQDHSPWVEGLLATELRGIAMMIWQTASGFSLLDKFSIWGALHFSGAHDVIVIVNTSPQTNDLCTEELRDRA